MKLYDLAAGSNPRRVRIFLAEKGIDIPSQPVDMMKRENEQPEYRKINPFGKMPALELDDGTVLTESMAICRYFEELNPEPPMFGRNPLEKAQVEMWNRRAELNVLIPIAMCFQHTSDFWIGRLEQHKGWGETSRANALAAMAIFDGHLKDREFVASDDYTVADITLQCGILLGKGVALKIPEELENLTAWWGRVTSRPTARA
ncbi:MULTISPECIES: glutathione S-transferase family protein [unclassified Minwuia]|jgi:glutathione S-transferase|uniref:glutathione S-transferase family protein n=1 Tax=unclassified Minwuia TaxID=2618799 RepID=UPI00247A38C2|nr:MULTISPECIES: glutathione S-transferase family protein [unclassified Minwuia]